MSRRRETAILEVERLSSGVEMRQTVKILIVTVVIVGAVVSPAWAGAQARVLGRVVDSGGNPIGSAQVTITTEAISDYEKKISVDEDGSFDVLLLDATHTYIFLVEAPEYAPVKEYVKVPVGEMRFEKEFRLKSREEIEKEEQEELLNRPGFKEMAEAKELLDAGNTDEALLKFEEAVAARDDLVGAWAALAKLYLSRGEVEKALARAESCLDIDPEVTQCLAVAANACKQLGDRQRESEYLERYRQLNPDDPAMLYNEAVEHLNARADEQARAPLERCLELDPDFPPCLFEYGMLLLRAGDTQGAKEALQHYLEAAPDGENAEVAADTLQWL